MYRAVAEELGRKLAERKIGVVYGGGRVGLMHAVAEGALAAGGRVVGVIPTVLVEQEVAHDGLTELHVTDTMHTRKAMIGARSDAFIALPGGYGTFEEMFEALAWQTLKIHAKPVLRAQHEWLLRHAAGVSGRVRGAGNADPGEAGDCAGGAHGG